MPGLTTDLPPTADVVVVGGGVVGAATAFFAARVGLRAVVAAGGFRAQFDNPYETALVLESIATYESFAEIARLRDFDLGIQKQGYLFVTSSPVTAKRQAQRVASQRAWGVDDVELLDGGEARFRFPYLSERVVSARFRANDGFLDPKRLTYGYAQASSATFVVSTEVSGFSLQGGRIAAVQTNRGAISTDNLVVAAGPFARPIARLAGLELPITTVRRQKLTVMNLPEVPLDAPFVIDEDNGGHWRPTSHGAQLMFTDPTTPPSDPAWDVPVSHDFAFLLLDPNSEHAVARVCPFWRTVWERGSNQWLLQAGQYAYTRDHQPFLGPTPVPGLHLNVGYSGHGVMGSAGGSRLVVDLLVGKLTQSDNPFRFDRPIAPHAFDVI